MDKRVKTKIVLQESSPESSKRPVRHYDPRPKKIKKEKVSKFQKIIKEYKNATRKEIFEAIRDNFIFGFLGAILVVFISKNSDMMVLLGYITYYLYMAKIVNRPKYVTDLGKIIIFPFASASGAFIGYKLSNILLLLI